MTDYNSIYGRLNTEENWYALKTRSRFEKKIFQRIHNKGITTYLPLQTTIRQWSDRKKKVVEPLFTCYVFVKIALKDRFKVLDIDGAVSLVSFEGIPAVIPEVQINWLKQLLDENNNVDIENEFTKGQRVKVIKGPLRGVEGILRESKTKTKLIILIDVLQQAVSVEIKGGSVIAV